MPSWGTGVRMGDGLGGWREMYFFRTTAEPRYHCTFHAKRKWWFRTAICAYDFGAGAVWTHFWLLFIFLFAAILSRRDNDSIWGGSRCLPVHSRPCQEQSKQQGCWLLADKKKCTRLSCDKRFSSGGSAGHSELGLVSFTSISRYHMEPSAVQGISFITGLIPKW